MSRLNHQRLRYIVVHCTATQADRDYTPEMMLRDHKERGFSTWGYHYYIRKDGQVVALRPAYQVGAHAKGYNSNSIGVCYEGGVRAGGNPSNPRDAADTRTPAQKTAMRVLISGLLRTYRMVAIQPIQVVGHRDLSPDTNGNGVVEPHEWVKMCPCFNARTEYADL
jgi:N-acetylmuramoyl-L-alanine amidase